MRTARFPCSLATGKAKKSIVKTVPFLPLNNSFGVAHRVKTFADSFPTRKPKQIFIKSHDYLFLCGLKAPVSAGCDLDLQTVQLAMIFT
jgi:hypothetical protein